jgi:hypothetical protein
MLVFSNRILFIGFGSVARRQVLLLPHDGVYHTYSGVIFDHCQYHLKSFRKGPTQFCSVFGPTCDALDTISLVEELPDMELG